MATGSKTRKFLKLNWFGSPSKSVPHGLWGIVSVLTGLYLISHSISGNLEPYSSTKSSPLILILYSISTLFNAIAGYRLADKAWVETRTIFKQCAILQVCLVYYVIRFSSHFSEASFWPRINRVTLPVIQLMDVTFSISTFLCILLFQQVARVQWEKSKSISFGISVGSMALLLLSVYPIQLVIFGQDWWDCIQHRYEAQSIGMVAFIYVPSTVTFSLILFGATLYQRGILSDVEFGAGSALIVMVCLVGTVLSQELHIPDVSTQRIYLPCVEPEIGSTEAVLVRTLDFSRYARMILTAVLNVDFEDEGQECSFSL